jgi:minor histocompatibility antigen H13
MELFKERQKEILWGVLVVFLLLPMIFKVNISFQLLFNSCACVCLGALYSISIVKGGLRSKASGTDDEVMQMSDALKFPFQASMALIVLYVLFTNVDNNLLLAIFKINFGMLGTTCIGTFLYERVNVLFPRLADADVFNKKFTIFGSETHIHLTTHKIAAFGIGAVISLMYVITDHWSLNNLLGIAFTIAGIMLLKIAQFKIVLILLWILFFYDIFWVFGSDVMVTVATKFDVPIKLKFPDGNGKFSILGLGDMVIPGLLLALALKFDVDCFFDQVKSKISNAAGSEKAPTEVKSQDEKINIRTPVFNGACIGYALGIVSTMIGMSLMKHAQPALLYLVPTCSLGVLIPVIMEKRFKLFWSYNAEKDEKEKDK